MADVKIRVVGEDAASKELGKVNKSLEEMKKGAGDAGDAGKGMGVDLTMALMGINQGLEIASKLVDAFKAAFDFTFEAAQLQQTEAAFSSMMGTIGMNASVMNEWRDAVGGTVSDLDIMVGFQTLAAGATDDLTKAFADSNAELLQIARAASALNPHLGDTAYMYESIARGIKRSSPLILDNLGIVVKVGEANEKYAESIGKTVGELTAQEKQMALLNEVLASGGQLIDQLGGSVESATDPWLRFAAALENSRNQAMRNVNELGFLPELLNDIADNTNEVVTQQGLLNQAFEMGIIEQSEYNHAMMMLGQTGKANTEMIDELKLAIDGANATYIASDEHLVRMAQNMGYLSAETEAVTESTNLANAAMQTYTASMLFKMAAENLSAEAALALAYSMGLVDERTVYATGQIEYWSQLLEEEKISVDTYNTLVASLADNMGRITDRSAKISIDWAETGSPSPAAMQYMGQYWNPTPKAAGGEIHAAAGLPVHWVGEMGPEPFIPQVAGRIVSNTQAVQTLRESRGGGSIVNVTINTPFNFADEIWAEQNLAPLFRNIMRQEGLA